jgi:hypothetical protein
MQIRIGILIFESSSGPFSATLTLICLNLGRSETNVVGTVQISDRLQASARCVIDCLLT